MKRSEIVQPKFEIFEYLTPNVTEVLKHADITYNTNFLNFVAACNKQKFNTTIPNLNNSIRIAPELKNKFVFFVSKQTVYCIRYIWSKDEEVSISELLSAEHKKLIVDRQEEINFFFTKKGFDTFFTELEKAGKSTLATPCKIITLKLQPYLKRSHKSKKILPVTDKTVGSAMCYKRIAISPVALVCSYDYMMTILDMGCFNVTNPQELVIQGHVNLKLNFVEEFPKDLYIPIPRKPLPGMRLLPKIILQNKMNILYKEACPFLNRYLRTASTGIDIAKLEELLKVAKNGRI